MSVGHIPPRGLLFSATVRTRGEMWAVIISLLEEDHSIMEIRLYNGKQPLEHVPFQILFISTQ